MTSDPGMTVEVVRAEASRFRHPLVLIHGLWTGGWIWSEAAPFFAHRGWDVWIPSFPANAAGRADLGARREALVALRRELPAAPVLVTHDAGLVVADAVAVDVAAPAIVALMPTTEPVAVNPWRRWMIRLGAGEVPVPSGEAADAVFSGLPQRESTRVAADSGSLVRAVGAVMRRPRYPTRGLVICSPNDAAAPLSVCERLAKTRGWEVDSCRAAGHFPLFGPAAPALVDRVHRWLVRAIGRELLAWIEDDDEGE